MQTAWVIGRLGRVRVRQRKRANCVVARGEDFLRIELAKRQSRAAHLNHLAQAKILRIQFRSHALGVNVLPNANERVGRELFFDYSLVISRLCATMFIAHNFASNSICPLEVIGDVDSKNASFPLRFGQRRSIVNQQPHFTATRESCSVKPVAFETVNGMLAARADKAVVSRRSLLYSAEQHCDESAVESLALAIRLWAIQNSSSCIDAEQLA